MKGVLSTLIAFIVPELLGCGSRLNHIDAVKLDSEITRQWVASNPPHSERHLSFSSAYTIVNKLDDSSFNAEYKFIYNLPSSPNLDLPHNVILQALIQVLIDRERCQDLVNMLAVHFPPRVFDERIESVLAKLRLSNPMQSLASVWRKTQDKAIKSLVVDALQYPFVTIREQYVDDSEFVNACADWYVKNESTIKFNDDYLSKNDMKSSPDLYIRRTENASQMRVLPGKKRSLFTD